MSHITKHLEEAFSFRHACKDFLPDKKISEADFDMILKAAHTSPSSFGFEPWKFLVIQDPKVREVLKPVSWGAQNQMPNSSHFVVILARRGEHLRPDADYIQYMMKEIKQFPPDIVEVYTNFYTQFQEEDFKLENDKDLFDWAKRQTYIPLANMMHTAALMEIDSCPIEGFHEDKTNQLLAQHCGVDLSEYGISVMVSFGYRTQPPKHEKVRRPRHEVIETL